MDALPIGEETGRPHASRNPGRMHACGHDGHTRMLLAAARYLSETRNFNGTVNFIFQPGEEGCGGALAMLQDGLFDRFPCDAVFGMHNMPGLAIGRYSINTGAFLAGGAFFDIEVHGKGSHGGKPEVGIDPVLTACHITAALQSIVSRNVTPADIAVVSVTKIAGGDAYNVIPQTARIGGTVRALTKDVLALVEERMRRIPEGMALSFGATASVDFRIIFAPLHNSAEQTQAIADTAAEIVGEAKVDRAMGALSVSEDLAFMLEKVRGAYILLGNGDSAARHNPKYDFNDATTPYGATVYARLVERSRGLTAREIPTPLAKSTWTAAQVQRILQRIGDKHARESIAKRRKRKQVAANTDIGAASNPIEGVVNGGKDRSIAALIASERTKNAH